MSPNRPNRPTRLNRILSQAGITSRRKADDLILAGRVRVNGRMIDTPGVHARWGEDDIQVDGRPVPPPSPRTYLMLNKPFGFISSFHDPEGRPVVMDLLKDVKQRVYPVGRLDFDTMGLLLFTDDGDWAQRLSHPRYRIPRTYKATVEGPVGEDEIKALKKGIPLDDGFSGPARVTVVRRERHFSTIRLTISVGKKRIVRRMMETVGHPVIHLIRIGFGPLELGNLKVGAYRHLEEEEIRTAMTRAGSK